MMKWIPIEEEHLQLVLDWRTSEHVTRYMYTDIAYDLVQQQRWLESIRCDEHGRYWLMSYRDRLIGYISLTSIDRRHKRAYWNFYIGEPEYAMLAGFVGAYMYNYAFYTLDFEKLMGEVMAGNESVRKLHLQLGAREVGVLEKHIFKYDEWHDVYIYEMTKDRWSDAGKKYVRYVPEVEYSPTEKVRR